MNDRVLIDPGSERDPIQREPRALPDSLDGIVLGLLDISKPRGDVFLDELEAMFAERGASVRRYSKPTFTRPAPDALRGQIAQECDVVLEALAD